MQTFFANRSIAESIGRSIGKGFVIICSIIAISSCSQNTVAPIISESAGASSPTTEASISPNLIEPKSEVAYRIALEASKISAGKEGLTELWYDTEQELMQVIAQDPASKKFASYDVIDETAYPIDESSMMPARLLAELDGLIAGGVDVGSVTGNISDGFVITNTLDLIVYVTTYKVDSEGRLASASIVADEELLGDITYTYSVTKEGRDAISAS